MTIPIQLAIQGGGAKITYLLAALEAVQSLQREGVLRVTRIAGTSAGALAGALLAAGVDMPRARDAFASNRDALLRAFPAPDVSLRAAWCLLTRRPFWNAAPLRRLLRELLAPCERLGDLKVPLVIVASDLTNMQPCVYSDTSEPLISSLLDSAGIPFFLRTPPGRAEDGYRVIVDGGLCENLPSDQLSFSAEEGEVVGITFSATRAGEPLRGALGFTGALIETAINASVLRAQLDLGPNNFVIRTEGGSFDFRRAFHEALGAEYRETRLRAEDFFRRYAARAREVREEAAAGDGGARLQHVVTSLRSMYQSQQEPIRFEMLSVRIVVTAPSHVQHEIVFRAARDPVSCYRVRLIPARQHRTQCEAFDRNYEPVPFDLVPISEDELLLFFREPILPGDPRAPVTLRVRDTVSEALRVAGEGRDELLIRASRADRPIGSVEIVVHLPEELADTVIGAAAGPGGVRMTPAELLRYAAPAGFVTLGWKGERVPPNTLFGCNLVRR
jgi:NTE family protein